ncbi:MAG: WG repeat-containing protein [Oscillospiraceae bacterium]|nr:WG repeat-containing protein [Oscillospiraceae bacterium]
MLDKAKKKLLYILLCAVFILSFLYSCSSRAPDVKYKITYDPSEPSASPAKFEDVGYGGITTVHKTENGELKYGFMDKTGKVIIDYIYDNAGNFDESGLVAVCKNSKWGFIDISGNIAIPMIYQSVGYFYSGRTQFEKDDKFGIIDTSGNIVVPADYDNLRSLDDGYYIAMQNGKCGIISSDGIISVPIKYDYADDFKDGMASVDIDGAYGFIDEKFNLAIPAVYNAVYPFSDGLAMVCNYIYGSGGEDGDDSAGDFVEGSKTKFIDKSGNVIIDAKEYDYIDVFRDGLAHAVKDGKSGYIDTRGNIAIPFVYDDGGGFYDGLAWTSQVGKCGYIDSGGKTVVPFIYDRCRSFENGYAVVNQYSKDGIINQNGELIVPCEFDEILSVTKDGFAVFSQNDKKGILEILK